MVNLIKIDFQRNVEHINMMLGKYRNRTQSWLIILRVLFVCRSFGLHSYFRHGASILAEFAIDPFYISQFYIQILRLIWYIFLNLFIPNICCYCFVFICCILQFVKFFHRFYLYAILYKRRMKLHMLLEDNAAVEGYFNTHIFEICTQYFGISFTVMIT